MVKAAKIVVKIMGWEIIKILWGWFLIIIQYKLGQYYSVQLQILLQIQYFNLWTLHKEDDKILKCNYDVLLDKIEEIWIEKQEMEDYITNILK